MKEQAAYLPVETLKKFMKDVFLGLGVPNEDADICTEVLITSDLFGIESHGVGRLKMYYDRIRDGIQKPATKYQVIKETETTALIDGNHGMGQVIAYQSMEMAIAKAREYGMGSVAVRNSTHYGIAGYYPLMAVKAGQIGLTVTNARPSIAPTFGVEPMLGTNPLTFGLPTDEAFPFLIDCATSISQRGKIEVLARAEEDTPAGWAIDKNGRPVTDTAKLLKDLTTDDAALLPVGGFGELLGGHKGYGWATLVEILSAALQDGACMKQLKGFDENGKKVPYKLGHFFMAIDIEHFLPITVFKKIAGNILRQLRNSKKAPGERRIYTAGEKEFESRDKVLREGVPVNKNLQKDILKMQSELGLTQYNFQF